jgi:3-deoxy-D-manno-octulosonate 8-phosphate phosphatase (KDO 8-P phosphatase)
MTKNKKMLLILDVDGVLTDGKKYYDNTGKGVYKTFCDRDFTIIKKFRAVGIQTIFLSGDKNVNEQVAKNRKIPFYCNRENNIMVDKSNFVKDFEKVYNIEKKNMIYVGDDIFDVAILKEVGYAFCPKDAAQEVKKISCVLNKNGGDNCLSDLYAKLLSKKLFKEPTIEQIIEEDKNESF